MIENIDNLIYSNIKANNTTLVLLNSSCLFYVSKIETTHTAVMSA